MTLSKKLMLSFVFSIIFSIFITSFISNTMINRRFDSYLIEEQNNTFEQIRKDINQVFIEKEGNLTSEDISKYASIEGIYIEIRNPNDNTLCHSNNKDILHKNMMGRMMRHHRKMNSNFYNKGNYVEKTFSLLDYDNNIIGNLIIGYIDNSHLTQSALVFKDTLSISFVISGIIAVIIGFIISMFLSKSLTNPLINITNVANEIRNGRLDTRSDTKINIKEVEELSHSINYLAETLENQESLRKRYASDIAHELRTPLTTLKSHVEAIIDGIWEANDEHLTILLDEINRLTKLVEDLRNTFKSLEVHLNMNRTRFNISYEIKNIISTFKPIFEKENYSLETSIEEDIQVSMDKDRLKQIMNNLLSNSIKHLKDNGKVTVSLSNSQNNIIITVEDNGVGIKEEDLPHIFERFYKADTSRSKETGGAGLGLAITKSLVEAHSGSIHVESKFGEGTKFTILLPIDIASPTSHK